MLFVGHLLAIGGSFVGHLLAIGGSFVGHLLAIGGSLSLCHCAARVSLHGATLMYSHFSYVSCDSSVTCIL